MPQDRPVHTAERTLRQRTLPQIGDSGQDLLSQASIAVVGAGGLGSPVISYLAAAGIGTLHVIDDDRVELSNLNRQTLHGVDTLGGLKTDGAVSAARRLAPETTVVPHAVRLTDENAADLLADADLIMDGSDSFTTRFIVHRAATALGTPVVFGALMQWNGQVTVFWSDPPVASGLPAVVLTDVFPDNASTHSAPGCAEAGVLGAVVGITGSLMALEAIKLVLGTGTPLLGRMMLIDGLSGTTTDIPLAPSAPAAPSAPSAPSDIAASAATPTAEAGAAPIDRHDVDPAAVWLDVRRPEESRERPGPPGTVELPLDRLLRLRHGPEQPLPPDHPLAPVQAALRPGGVAGSPAAASLLPFCAAGPRSATAARHLARLGWPVQGYLDGGLAPVTTEPPGDHRG
ncbi:ThiF family adenylyltransferase [Citricoccus sp.]|uniref:ThiF family adenylyltransferase n=1 Tax=Citricoccus sp. TaxID=1978372 RepID=UPI0028BEB7F4|nr:ThiF family adenylyltransferase [Citricoccus sp.]